MEFNVADLVEAAADAVPEREALVAGAVRHSFAALDQRANRAAHHLAANGVKAGDHVGIYAYNCAEFVETMLACYKLRAVPINVNYRYVEQELHYLFDNADLVAVVHQRQFTPRIAAVRDRAIRKNETAPPASNTRTRTVATTPTPIPIPLPRSLILMLQQRLEFFIVQQPCAVHIDERQQTVGTADDDMLTTM